MKRRAPFWVGLLCVCACLLSGFYPCVALCAQSEESDTVFQENLLPAQQGDPQAQVFVGYLYETGQTVTQNYTKAAQWYQKAAEQGNTIAQSQLGNMYLLGKGVPQNYILAYMWFSLAAKGGNSNARDLKRTVAVRMSPAEIAEAKRMAGEWRPRK